MPKCELDAIDRRIVTELQANARLSNVELADKVGLSPSPCLRRVRRLERDGYIDGYRASLRRGRIGLGFSAFLGVKIVGHANVPSRIAVDASQLYAKNLLNFLALIIDKDKTLKIDAADEIIKGTLLTKDGAVVHPALAPKPGA